MKTLIKEYNYLGFYNPKYIQRLLNSSKSQTAYIMANKTNNEFNKILMSSFRELSLGKSYIYIVRTIQELFRI